MPATAAPWAALLPAAVAGTRRQSFAPVPGLTPGLGSEADATEKQLLLTAGNLALVQRASHRFAGPARALPALPAETRPAVPAAAVRGLEALLVELSDGSEAGGDFPYRRVVTAALTDLRRLGYRLPLPTALRVLQSGRARDTDPRTVRRALGERGRWLNLLLVETSAWYAEEAGPDWPEMTARQRREYLAHLMRQPLQPDENYLPYLAALPARQRTQLLWQAWQESAGHHLPAPLQAELDALLAATPPAERPWTTTLLAVQGLANHPRLTGHPLVARLVAWTAPLLHLTRQPGQLPRVRVELPAAYDPAWKPAGLGRHNHFSSNGELESYLQELLSALGPRYWLAAWQLPLAEVVALVAAAPRGRLVLEAWGYSLGGYRPEPELVRALLALPRPPADPEQQAYLRCHLPLAERVAWVIARLPDNPAAPAEPEWVQLLSYWTVPLAEPRLLRPLLPVLAAALAQPRTRATARQYNGLDKLLDNLHEQSLDARLYPEVQAALGAVVPERYAVARSLGRLLRGLAARYDLLQACRAATLPAVPCY